MASPLRKKIIKIGLDATEAFKGLKLVSKAFDATVKMADTAASAVEKSAAKVSAALKQIGDGAASVRDSARGGGGGSPRGGAAPKGDYGASNKFKLGKGRGRGELDDLAKTDWSKTEKGVEGVGKAAASAGKGIGSMAVAAGQLLATGVIAAVSALGAAFVDSAKKAIEFESSMADVAKVVEGLKTPNGEVTEDFRKMEGTIFDLSKRIAVTPDGFAKIFAAAGEAGIAKNELDQFAESTAKVSVAFGVTAEQAGDGMAKLRSGLGLSQEGVEQLAGTMNLLSNNMAVTAEQALEITLKAGAVGKAANVSAQEVTGLGAAMVASGAQSDVAATATKNYILALSSGETATKRQRDGFAALGLSAEHVAKKFTESAETRLAVQREVLEKVAKLGDDERVSVLSNLFGKESLGAIAGVVGDVEKFNKAMELSLDTVAAASSVTDEYNVRSKTTANAIQLLKNNFEVLSIELGQKLLPYVNQFAEWMTSPEVQEFGQQALSALSEGATMLYERFKTAWEIVGPFVVAIGEGLVGAFQTAWPLITGLMAALQDFGAAVFEALGLAGEGGEKFGSGLGETLKTVVVGALEAVTAAVGFVSASVRFLGDEFGWLISLLKGSVMGALDIVGSTLSGIGDIVGGVVGAFKDLASGNLTGGLIRLGNALIDGLLGPLKAIIRQVIALADAVPGGSSIVPDAVRKFAHGSITDRALELAKQARDGQKAAAPEEMDLGASRSASQPKTKQPAKSGFVGGDEGAGGGSSGGSGKKGKKGKEHFASDNMSDEEKRARFDALSKLGKARKPSEDREYNRLSKDLDIDKVGKLSKADAALANMDPALAGILRDEETGKVHDDPLSKAAFKHASGGGSSGGSGSVGPSITNTYNQQQVTTTVTQQFNIGGASSSADNVRSSGMIAGNEAAKTVLTGISQVIGLRTAGAVMR